MKSVFTAAVLLASLICLGDLPQNCNLGMEYACMVGEWKCVQEVSVAPGLYTKIVTAWRIGLDSIPYKDPDGRCLVNRLNVIVSSTQVNGCASEELWVLWYDRRSYNRDHKLENNTDWLIRTRTPDEFQVSFSRISRDTLLADFDGKRVILIK
jgi:hypothetical protein